MAARGVARARWLALIGLMSMVATTPGHGQTFSCSEATAGQLSVQADVQCECRFFTASGLAGTPAGYRWDCGILRARMNQDVPATANPYPYPLPYALSLDRGFRPPRLRPR
jgi:hypothetical protein